MKWLIYILVAATVIAHYSLAYLNWNQRNEKQQMNFTLEMSKTHPVFIHPIEEKQ